MRQHLSDRLSPQPSITLPTVTPTMTGKSKAASALEALRDKWPSHGLLVRHLNRTFLKMLQVKLQEHRLTVTQWMVIRELWGREKGWQSELADHLGIEAPNMTATINGMAELGLVKRRRSSQDRRKIQIIITPAGRSLEAILLPIIDDINNQAARDFSDGEIREFHSYLIRMTDNLKSVT
jgi:DNA-binding MarR family transcriptional regulator